MRNHRTTAVRCPTLSPRQQELVDRLEQLTDRHGFPPSVRELADEMHLHPSRVQQLANQAQAKGALHRRPGAARAWRVVRSPLETR
jgi:repressor LexA